LSEEVLIRLKRARQPERRVFRQRHERVEAPPAEKEETQKEETQWVWLIDEDKLEDKGIKPPAADEEPTTQTRRRRRRRGGIRQHPELPGNRGKHLNNE
jgi:hypothetical protein